MARGADRKKDENTKSRSASTCDLPSHKSVNESQKKSTTESKETASVTNSVRTRMADIKRQAECILAMAARGCNEDAE